jgi:hypothetical protein
VVFGGVNDVEPEYFKKFPAVTGVAQTYDFAGTLALIHRLQPNVRRIAAVHCLTESGLASRHAFEKWSRGTSRHSRSTGLRAGRLSRCSST